MNRAVLCVSLLAAMPACSLIANPNDHTGHVRDGSVGPDVGTPRDANIDAPAPPIDAGGDAFTTPECTTPSDCGPGTTGLVQCLGQRCVFCAAPSESTPHVLRHATGLRPYLSMGIRRRATGPALVLVGTMGDSTAQPALIHRAEIDAPSAATDVPLASAVTAACPGAFDSLSSISFWPNEFDTPMPTTSIAVIAQNGTSTMLAQLTWPGTTGPLGADHCVRKTAPEAFVPSGIFLQPPTADGMGTPVEQVVRTTDGTSFAYVAYSYPDGVQTRYYTSFGGPTTPYAAMTSAGPFMVLGGQDPGTVVFWDPESDSGNPSSVLTPERTGDPSAATNGTTTMAGELLHFVVAYPVGNRVRLLNVDCTTMCMAVGESADLHTDAMTVTAARLVLVGEVPVLLTSEHLASGVEQVVLRVLRANRLSSYDAPGGGAHGLVLDTTPSGTTIADIQLAAVGGASTRYAATWMFATTGAESSVRLQSFDTCP